MSDTEYYTDQAELCRQRAAASRSAEIKQHWLELAERYDELAARSLPLPASVQRQPMHQQQTKSTDE